MAEYGVLIVIGAVSPDVEKWKLNNEPFFGFICYLDGIHAD